jgi:hypothetical protein
MLFLRALHLLLLPFSLVVGAAQAVVPVPVPVVPVVVVRLLSITAFQFPPAKLFHIKLGQADQGAR